MKGLRILLVEDNSIIAADLTMMLKDSGYEVLGPYPSAEEALPNFLDHGADLAILDIELKGKQTGLDLAQDIVNTQSIPLIFITALLDDKTKEKAKKLGAVHFLNKPFNERNLLNAIEITIEAAEALPSLEVHKNATSIFIKINRRFLKIPLAEIDFVEASGHYLVVYSGDKQFSHNISLSRFMELHAGTLFLKTHRSFVVNMANVTDFDDNYIYFSQKKIPISQSYRKKFKELITSF